MTTKYRIAEQVQRLYARFLDKDNPSDVIDIREVMLLVRQSLNKVLKLQVAESFKAGEYDIPKCNLLQYTCATVSDSANSRAYIVLPAIPITLPMDMGIWSISAASAALAPYLPIPSQDILVFGTVANGTNVSALEGQVGYYVQGKRVYFTKDITTSGNGLISSVIVNLFVADFDVISDTEMLPVSPEVESAIIDDVLQSIGSGRVSQAELSVKQG